ncbi:MAG TPA: non-homologous end-joining DNA ligase [Actinospica sp.]|nr:non-homologous end-joining DNA ligase [Actinospica sp.]
MPERIRVQVGDRQVTLTHLDKPLWPAFSKAQVLDYYLKVADLLIPHVRRRPAAFLRCPAGVGGPRFFTHEAPEGLPNWIATAEKGGRTQVSIDDTATLISVANAYCLEIHVPQWTADTGPDLHDRLIFDMDPGEGADITTCARVALLVREELDADRLVAVPATSGGLGLHVYVALDPPWHAEDVSRYAKGLAHRLTVAHRDLITHTRGPKARSGGRVLVDWAQNASRATTSAPYTLRARDEAPGVSVPLGWPEVETATPESLSFTPADVLARIAEHGDLAAALLDPAPF